MEGDEPTQATQNVLDPRRVGKQNSGFSDEDISDIICVLYPYSDSAREELKRLAAEDSPHIIGKDEADGVEPDYAHEDYADRFETHTVNSGNHAIILRLSAQLKSPTAGYAFGRNTGRCDLVFVNDPRRRISNIHFRVYVNEYGSVMIEDQSTNGTWVDRQLLTSRPHNNNARAEPPITRWVLSSGAIIRIYLHEETQDLAFRVRIPRRDDEYDQAYTNKVDEFFARNGIKKQNETITPGPAGHVDLFRAPIQAPPLHPHPPAQDETTQQNYSRSPSRRREPQHHPREWTGSGKYNRTGMIGRGAFAVVHKVTSKYDGKPYAAKELEKRKFIKNGILDQKVENEMRIMKRITHPNIVKYIENFDWDDRLLIIIMEFIPGGDLGKFISEQGPLSEVETRSMSRQLSNALGYLHANNITHRDVKPDNILINSYDPIDVKLTDFGLSKMVDSEQTFLRTFCGTLLYCAPEVYTEYAEYDENGVRSRGKKVRRMPGQRYNHAVDIWSLGGVLFYAMTGSPPYPVKSGISYSELLHKIMTTPLNITPLQRHHISDSGIDFLRRMLRNRPERRATIADIVAHPWSGNTESTIVASQSYDEITDDEDMVGDLSQFQPQHEFDRVSDSMGEESEKENYPDAPDAQAPRLFGEVGVSAIGSSGVIPEDFLNLPADNPHMEDSDVLGSDMDEAYQSDEPKPQQGRSRRAYRQTSASIAQHQSDDQLQSLVEEVASQSLGGNESVVHNLAVPGSAMQSLEFNTSKRKPHPTDTSDEFDENTPPGKPIFKRLKSEGNIDALSNEAVEEYRLLAQMQKAVPGTGRQIEGPASKRVYWEPDRATWHLNYPEMMLSQWDAFTRTATLRNELFCPGKSPLWDLAMKHFPPTSRKGELNRRAKATFRTASSGLDDRMVIDTMDFPATAPPIESQPIPDTLPSDTGIIVPMADEVAPERLVGIVESHPDSCITDISFNITDSLVSFGRGLENTVCYSPKTESRVPKFAMKILLWRDDNEYDPKDTPHPWSKNISADPNSYSFYISTKATSGISINGYILPSTDAKTPGGPSRYWTRLYNGDEILLWGKPEPSKSTLVTFKCFWGGSSRARGENKALQTVDPSLAQKLDAASRRTEKRIERTAERHARQEEARLDLELRMEYIENERERSRNFELKRQEAISFLNSRPSAEGSRRGSPMSAPPTSRMRNGQFSRANSANDAGLSIL